MPYSARYSLRPGIHGQEDEHTDIPDPVARLKCASGSPVPSARRFGAEKISCERTNGRTGDAFSADATRCTEDAEQRNVRCTLANNVFIYSRGSLVAGDTLRCKVESFCSLKLVCTYGCSLAASSCMQIEIPVRARDWISVRYVD